MSEPPADPILPYASPNREEEHRPKAKAALAFSIFAVPLDFLMIPVVQLMPSTTSRGGGLPQLATFLLPSIVIFWASVVLAAQAAKANEKTSAGLATAAAVIAVLGPPALLVGLLMIFGAPC